MLQKPVKLSHHVERGYIYIIRVSFTFLIRYDKNFKVIIHGRLIRYEQKYDVYEENS